jgi:hypothetical protein
MPALPVSVACCRTREVQMTWDSIRFIQPSQASSVPLYVSPFFSSTSCSRQRRQQHKGRQYQLDALSAQTARRSAVQLSDHGRALRRSQEGQRQLQQ